MDTHHGGIGLFLRELTMLLVVCRIVGKFGEDFDLAVWRIVRTPLNLNPRQ